MKRLLSCILPALVLLCALPASGWQIGVGQPMPHRCFSIAAIPGLGLLAGSYAGGGWVYTIDPDTLEWQAWRKLAVSIGHESIAYFMAIDDRIGVNAFTEDAAGPQCWTAWQDQGWRFRRTSDEFPLGMEYALGGPEAAVQGIAAVSTGHGRLKGGVLCRWQIDAWKPITSELWHEGQPCLIWTSAEFNGRKLAGASASTSHYNAPGVGLLAEWANGAWHIIPIPTMAGIVRLTQLAGDPGALYLSTTHGAIWRTADLTEFALYHQGNGTHGDAWIFEIDGSRVVACAGGQVWDDGQLVIDRERTAWMSPIKITLPDGREVLAGTIVDEDEPFSRVMRIEKETEP